MNFQNLERSFETDAEKWIENAFCKLKRMVDSYKIPRNVDVTERQMLADIKEKRKLILLCRYVEKKGFLPKRKNWRKKYAQLLICLTVPFLVVKKLPQWTTSLPWKQHILVSCIQISLYRGLIKIAKSWMLWFCRFLFILIAECSIWSMLEVDLFSIEKMFEMTESLAQQEA